MRLRLINSRIVALREHIQVHSILDALAVENAAGPIANDLVVVASVLELLGLPRYATRAFSKDDLSFFIKVGLSVKVRPVDKFYILKQFI